MTKVIRLSGLPTAASTACTGAAGGCGKPAETAAAQDRLTGARSAFAGQRIAAGRGPAPEQARLLMQGLYTTNTNVNFAPAAEDALVSDDVVSVTEQNGNWVFAPETPTAGLIF